MVATTGQTQDTSAKIMQAAKELFAENGYDGVTIKRIAHLLLFRRQGAIVPGSSETADRDFSFHDGPLEGHLFVSAAAYQAVYGCAGPAASGRSSQHLHDLP